MVAYEASVALHPFSLTFAVVTLHVTMSVSVASIMPIHYSQPPQYIPCLGIHRGALDQTLVTTEPPPRVMERVHQVLHDMGVLVQVESEFKYRCIRTQQKRYDAFGPYLTIPSSAVSILCAYTTGRSHICR